MKLTYRGQTDTLSQITANIENQTILTYRGQSYQHLRLPVSIIPKSNLIYRGVPYLTSGAVIYNKLISVFS